MKSSVLTTPRNFTCSRLSFDVAKSVYLFENVRRTLPAFGYGALKQRRLYLEIFFVCSRHAVELILNVERKIKHVQRDINKSKETSIIISKEKNI